MSPDGAALIGKGVLPCFEVHHRAALVPALRGDQALVDAEASECTISLAPSGYNGTVIDPQHPDPVLPFGGRRAFAGRHVWRIALQVGDEVAR